jgi:tagatose 6-phosphate kinase
MILCVGTTPAAQRVMVFRRLTLDAVNRAATTLDGAAGKALNVAKVLKALGQEPVLTGFFGGDRGRWLRAELEARGIELDIVEVDAPTRECVTVIDESNGTHTELVEESRPVTPGNYEQFRRIVHRRALQAQAVVMSGTITPGGPMDLYFDGTRLAHATGALSVVDAQGAALTEALRARPGLIKPNRTELAATLGCELRDEAALVSAMREMRRRGAGRVVVTAGKEASYALDGESCWKIQGPVIRAVNPIGSGDAFTAALVWRLLAGDELGEACRWGAACGAANALTLMAGEVIRSEVERLVRETSLTPL